MQTNADSKQAISNKPHCALFGATITLLMGCITSPALEVRVQPGSRVNSPQVALDVIRAARAAGDSSSAKVVVEAGTYAISEPLKLLPTDSQIHFVAAPETKPLFTGGRKVDGWKRDAKGIWRTHVGPDWKFEALWVNGKRATRARTPNVGFIQAVGQPSEPVEGVPLSGPASKTLLNVPPADAEALGQLSLEAQKEVQVLVYHSWDVSRLKLAAVAPVEGKLQFSGGVRDFFTLEPWHRLQFENYEGALDAPGEWFLAGDGTLSYIPLPGQMPETSEVIAPVASQWLILSGAPDRNELVRDVSFEGIEFSHQNWVTPKEGIHAGQAEQNLPLPAVEMRGATAIRFAQCSFTHTSTHAVWLRAGCSDTSFSECLFRDLGAGGVYVGDPSINKDGPLHTHHVRLENCILREGGRQFPAGIGVVLFHASDSVLRHCDIGDFFYSAVSIGWTWGYKPTVAGRNLVEFCHLHHLGWGVLSDMGAVYTLGAQLGTVVRNNHMHDISCASYGGWGMYNDEGSTGVLWENNLVHDTQSAGYHQHYGRGNIVRNNIIAWGREEHLRRSKPEDFLAFAFERNIVLMGDGRLFTHLDKNWWDGRVCMADNVYWRESTTPNDFAGKSWAEWQAFGNDVRSLVADPLFRDPARGDWSLKSESPALALGFRPFDWNAAGVTGSTGWRDLAAQPLPPITYGVKPKPAPLRLEQTFDKLPADQRLKLGRNNPHNPALFAVANIPGADGLCLELRDGPDQLPAFEPHFFFDPGHESGTTRVSFDLRAEAGYNFLHEWRDNGSPYRSSVALHLRNGVLQAGGRKLLEIPPLTWVHLDVESKLGEDASGEWSVTVTPKGGNPQRFDGLKPNTAPIKELRWLGFISPGTLQSKGWMDNLRIEPNWIPAK